MGDMWLCLVILYKSIQRTEKKLTKNLGDKNYIYNTDSESMVLIAVL